MRASRGTRARRSKSQGATRAGRRRRRMRKGVWELQVSRKKRKLKELRRTKTPSENSCKNSCESLERTWGSALRDRREYRWVGEQSHRCDCHSSISGAEGGALDVGLHDSACSILFWCNAWARCTCIDGPDACTRNILAQDDLVL